MPFAKLNRQCKIDRLLILLWLWVCILYVLLFFELVGRTEFDLIRRSMAGYEHSQELQVCYEKYPRLFMRNDVRPHALKELKVSPNESI